MGSFTSHGSLEYRVKNLNSAGNICILWQRHHHLEQKPLQAVDIRTITSKKILLFFRRSETV